MKGGQSLGWTGEDLLGVLDKPGYSRSVTEHRPAGDRCGRVQMNEDIVGSRRNGPQLSTRHDDDDDEGRMNFSVALSPKTTRTRNNKHKQWSYVIVVSAMRRS